MYEVKITVEIPGLPEAINALAGAIGKGKAFTNFTQNGENNHQINNAAVLNINEKPAVKKNLMETEPAQTAQTTSTAVPTPAPVPAPVQTDAATTAAGQGTAKSYTLEDLSNAGADLIDQDKMPQLIDLLKKYGVQAVTQLDESAYSAFAEDMKALGAKL